MEPQTLVTIRLFRTFPIRDVVSTLRLQVIAAGRDLRANDRDELCWRNRVAFKHLVLQIGDDVMIPDVRVRTHRTQPRVGRPLLYDMGLEA